MTHGDFNANVRQITDTLNRHGVNYIIIGGVAGQLHGATRPTNDVDVVTENSAVNLKRLGDALRELNACIRGAPELPPPVKSTSMHRSFGNCMWQSGWHPSYKMGGRRRQGRSEWQRSHHRMKSYDRCRRGNSRCPLSRLMVGTVTGPRLPLPGSDLCLQVQRFCVDAQDGLCSEQEVGEVEILDHWSARRSRMRRLSSKC